MNYKKAIAVLKDGRTCALCGQDTEECLYCEAVGSYKKSEIAAAYDLGISSLAVRRKLAAAEVVVMELEGLKANRGGDK